LCVYRVTKASVPEHDRAAEDDEEQKEHEADQVEHEAVRADDAAKAEDLEKKGACAVSGGELRALRGGSAAVVV